MVTKSCLNFISALSTIDVGPWMCTDSQTIETFIHALNLVNLCYKKATLVIMIYHTKTVRDDFILFVTL